MSWLKEILNLINLLITFVVRSFGIMFKMRSIVPVRVIHTLLLLLYAITITVCCYSYYMLLLLLYVVTITICCYYYYMLKGYLSTKVTYPKLHFCFISWEWWGYLICTNTFFLFICLNLIKVAAWVGLLTYRSY